MIFETQRSPRCLHVHNDLFLLKFAYNASSCCQFNASLPSQLQLGTVAVGA